ncbi:MAG: hypothetical protein A2103_05585 [Gammaproteobacteria bacterium GWF2_41_13]|nr:MAG: hypothetical protein A2103_05585 [Gammaproteobacteria bacterium GWF2_41_13]
MILKTKKAFLQFIILLSCFIFSLPLIQAKPENTVNILTWWGYLLPENIAAAENTCHTKISFDEYYSDSEFLRRWEEQKQNYDMAIFSDVVFNSIKSDISMSDSSLWEITKQYNPIIRNHYQQYHFPKNIVFFTEALTGFIWNPAVVQLDKNDSIDTIFKKAGTNTVAIFDDPIEVNRVIKLALNELGQPIQQLPFSVLTPEYFKKVTQNTRVIITDDNEKVYQHPDFAFALTWQGNAIFYSEQKRKTYPFLVHPQLSYISFDLLGITNNDPATLCVARTLLSPEAMTRVENTDYYFSPYLEDKKIISPYFKSIYNEFLNYLSRLPWIQLASRDEFEQLSKQWDMIRLNLNTPGAL